MFEKLKGTLHELMDSRKAVHSIITVLGAVFTVVLGFLFAHFSERFGLSPALQAKIPEAAIWLACLVVGAGASYQHGQGLADSGKEAAAIHAEAGPAVTIGSPEFKAAIQGMVVEGIKAGLDQGLAPPSTAIVAASLLSASPSPVRVG